MAEYLHKELTDNILKCFYCVYDEFGLWFLENVYQNALYFELQDAGFRVEAQAPIDVYYRNEKYSLTTVKICVNQSNQCNLCAKK